MEKASIGPYRRWTKPRRSVGVSRTKNYTSWPLPKKAIVVDEIDEAWTKQSHPRRPGNHTELYMSSIPELSWFDMGVTIWDLCSVTLLCLSVCADSVDGLVCSLCGLTFPSAERQMTGRMSLLASNCNEKRPEERICWYRTCTA